MFKSKEEILKEPMGDEYYKGNHPYKIGINKAFKSFAERVEFYKDYKNNEEMLSRGKTKEIWKQYPNRGNIPYNAITLKNYNDWLFDYCFGDVIE